MYLYIVSENILSLCARLLSKYLPHLFVIESENFPFHLFVVGNKNIPSFIRLFAVQLSSFFYLS